MSSPPRSSICAPRALRAIRWRSIGLGPSSQPPGMLSLARPQRASSAPRKITELLQLPHEPVRYLAGGHGPRVYVHRVPFALDGAAEAAQYAYRRVNVAQLGDVQQLRLARREHAGRHYGQHGVLRALDGHAACEAVSAAQRAKRSFPLPHQQIHAILCRERRIWLS